MIKAFIEATAGDLGRALLDFYLTNSIPINIVVAAYGLVMVMSWTNTVNMRKRLLYAMLLQMTSREDIKADAKVKRILKEISIPWEEVLNRARFPLIAARAGLIPYPKTIGRLQEIIPPEELALDALMMMGGKNKTMHRRPQRKRR